MSQTDAMAHLASIHAQLGDAEKAFTFLELMMDCLETPVIHPQYEQLVVDLIL